MQSTQLSLRLAATALGVALFSACSSSDDDAASSTGGQSGSAAATGGASNGGHAGTTTAAAGTGGNAGSGAGAGKGGGSASGGAPSSGGSSSAGAASGNGGSSGMNARAGRGGTAGRSNGGGGGTTSSAAGKGGSASGGAPSSGGTSGGGGTSGSTSATGWLYTQGNKVYVSDGNGGGTPWVGRGANVDDIFLCGYNSSLWLDSPGDTYAAVAEELITSWKATFLRVSLSMASFQTVSFLTDSASYKQPMTDAIHAMGKHTGVYVLITLRSDASMLSSDDATHVPSDSTSTPDKTQFPRGTDPVYEALVDTFANDAFVLFGVSNEPGGNTYSPDQLKKAMDHAVSTIRAEEDKLGVPHHVVAVQGNNWTSDISFYDSAPLKEDNVVYEVHGYPPSSSSYTFTHLPVIIGEYGSLDSSTSASFYADLEKKQIPNLAWDFAPYSNCAPDLLQTSDPTSFTPTDWGKIVKSYLADHAQ